jgi:hypothetical protein
MRFLRGIAFLLTRLLRALLLGWLAGLQWTWAMLRTLLERWRARRAEDNRQGRMSDERCVPVRHPALPRPDPLIYSQTFLMSLGLAVSWDNPDIQLFLNGVPVESSDLQAATEYEITARIWNGSTEAPVVGMPVRFTLHGFGIGTDGVLIGQTAVDLGVKGGPTHPAFATTMWTTPATAGHYCLKAHLDWFDDSNPNNNVGQENTNVAVAQSAAQMTFLLRNDHSERRRRYRFEADVYSVPDQPRCLDVDRKEGRERRRRRLIARQPLSGDALATAVLTRHDRSRYPLPPGWQIEFQPTEPVLGPGDEIEIRVVVTPPDDFVGPQGINVNAFDETRLAGGVTFFVEGS